jgi:hypothetical protein
LALKGASTTLASRGHTVGAGTLHHREEEEEEEEEKDESISMSLSV